MTLRRKRKLDARQERWSESQKIEAVMLWLATGSPTQTCAALSIPLATFEKWKPQPWFKEVVARVRDEETMELDTRLSRIVKKSLDLVEDRLENGNYQFNQKTGKLVQVPVNLRDSVKASAELMQRRDILRAKPEQKVLEETIDNRLLKLANEFAKFAKDASKKPQIELGSIIEGEVISVQEGP